MNEETFNDFEKLALRTLQNLIHYRNGCNHEGDDVKTLAAQFEAVALAQHVSPKEADDGREPLDISVRVFRFVRSGSLRSALSKGNHLTPYEVETVITAALCRQKLSDFNCCQTGAVRRALRNYGTSDEIINYLIERGGK